MKEEIKQALLHSLERGEDLNAAVASLIQAGYEKADVFEVANQILAEKKGMVLKLPSPAALPSAPKAVEEPLKKEEMPKAVIPEAEKIEKEKKAVSFKFAKVKFFLFSLILIFYYIFIFILRVQVSATWFGWLIFALPAFIFNIALIVNQETKKNTNLVLLVIIFLFLIGIFIFISLIQKNFLQVLKQLFLPKYFFIIEAYILSYALCILGLIERIFEEK
ncbi:MAG: hypothetical protein QW244_02120 [Candidatus Pacearchaeota archaeon]